MPVEDAPAVRIKDLVKDYPAPEGDRDRTPLRAVDGLSLDIPDGAFYGLLGPNGAGKSTSIHVLTGLADRTSGRVEVRGLDVKSDFRAVRRLLGLAPQEFAFDSFLTAREILVYQGMYYEMPRRDARSRADDLLERFELDHKRRNRVQDLSGGQKRRLLIAKSLMHDPDILILDEPTAGIDVALRRDLWSYLREQNREGKTILLTTHYIEEAEALCDTVGIIDQGRLVSEGSPETLIAEGSGDRVVVQLAAPYKGDTEALVAETGFDCTIRHDLEIVVSGGRGGLMASRILQALQVQGQRVENVEIKRRSLEEAFVRATGAEIAEDGTIVRAGGSSMAEGKPRGVNV